MRQYDLTDPHRRGYLQSSEEVFARTYAQYIAWKSGDQAMRDQLDAVLQSDRPGNRLTQWTHEEFAPIAQAMDALFERMQWLTTE